jgi:hypothetical protein
MSLSPLAIGSHYYFMSSRPTAISGKLKMIQDHERNRAERARREEEKRRKREKEKKRI